MKLFNPKFRVSKTNSKYLLAKEISEHYGEDLTKMMLGFIMRKGEQAVMDEFIQAQKVGTPIGLFVYRLKNIVIVPVDNSSCAS